MDGRKSPIKFKYMLSVMKIRTNQKGNFSQGCKTGTCRSPSALKRKVFAGAFFKRLPESGVPRRERNANTECAPQGAEFPNALEKRLERGDALKESKESDRCQWQGEGGFLAKRHEQCDRTGSSATMERQVTYHPRPVGGGRGWGTSHCESTANKMRRRHR